ncbi:MAG: IS630 transposase-related protein [Acetobacteraceae bacterium]
MSRTGGDMLWRHGKAYSQDLRERVFAVADEGAPAERVAPLLRVSVSYVSKVLTRRRETGETSARAQRGHVVPKLAGQYEAIRAQVTARPDMTVAELRGWLQERHGVSASEGVICETLKRLDLTRKKRPCGRASRTAPMLLRDAPRGGRSSLASIRSN